MGNRRTSGLAAGWQSLGRYGSSRSADSRTAVALDRQRKLLFWPSANYISPRRLLQDLADLGAKDGMLLDGGGSSQMAIGKRRRQESQRGFVRWLRPWRAFRGQGPTVADAGTLIIFWRSQFVSDLVKGSALSKK